MSGIERFGPAPGAPAEPVEVLPGILWLRLDLPFALDHVNVWLLEDGDGWTLIDTGVDDERTTGVWQRVLERLGAPGIRRVLVTHFHPDHMGLAGPLCRRTGAPFWTSATEWLQGRMLTGDDSPEFVEATIAHYRRCGLPEPFLRETARIGNAYRRRAAPPPASFHVLAEGDLVEIGGRRFEVLIGRGHAPEHICLLCRDERILIVGDQVLPRISPNVSVWPSSPDADPLADFLDTLERFRALPDHLHVLPSHDWPFMGLHARLDRLTRHHADRLDVLRRARLTGATAVEAMALLFPRDLDRHQTSFALGETLAHLNHLVRRVEAARWTDADDLYRFTVE